MYPSAAFNGSIKPGFSSGQAIEQVEAVCRRELPDTMSLEWTEITFLEQLVRNTGMMVFGLSVVFVFLVLAALYESWSLPLAVILVVPMCVLSSIMGVAIAKMDINLFTQIGFIVPQSGYTLNMNHFFFPGFAEPGEVPYFFVYTFIR